MKPGPATLALHTESGDRPIAVPLAPHVTLASVHRFRDLDGLLEAFHGKRDAGSFYRRFGHGNGRQLEKTVAALEGAPDAMATATGMSAVAAAFWAVLGRKGGHVVAANEVYGGTLAFLRDFIHAEVTFAPLPRLARAVRPDTRAIFVETISNPLCRVTNLPAVSRIARRVGAKLIVDNTFATPILSRPLARGADLVMHSGTKFLGGHGDAMAGVVCGSAALVRRARRFATVVGTPVSPLDAWLTLRGIRTLKLRVVQASRNASALARFLRRHRRVAAVHHVRGPMLSFEVKGGLRSARRLIRALRLVALVPSLGDVATTCTHPARSSHAYLTPKERAEVGVTDGLVRVSTGIEEVEDILSDLKQALAKL